MEHFVACCYIALQYQQTSAIIHHQSKSDSVTLQIILKCLKNFNYAAPEHHFFFFLKKQPWIEAYKWK